MSLVSDIQTILDESAAVFWPADQIYDAANQAQLDIWPELDPHAAVSASLTVAASTDLIDIPAAIMIPKYILGDNGEVFTTTHARLEQWYRDWRTYQPGRPKHFVLWDAGHLRPFPLADASYTFTIYGIGWPTEIVAGTQDITEDPLLKSAVAHHAAAQLIDSTMPAFAEESMKESTRLLHDYKVRLRNSQSHRIRRLQPASSFHSAQGGAVRIGRRFN